MEYLKEHKNVIIVTTVASFIGEILGVMAYYNGWLG